MIVVLKVKKGQVGNGGIPDLMGGERYKKDVNIIADISAYVKSFFNYFLKKLFL